MGSAALHLLLIEDDADDYLLVRDYLETIGDTAIVLEWASTYEAGCAALERGGYDVVLLDYHLGARSGLDILMTLRARSATIPVIILTGAGDAAADTAAQAAGAADFLDKGRLDAPTLGRAIRYATERARQQARVATAHDLVQSTLDALSAHIAVLDEAGTILLINGAWRRFATANGFEGAGHGLGSRPFR